MEFICNECGFRVEARERHTMEDCKVNKKKAENERW